MLRLHDTMTRRVEPLPVRAGGALRVYACGPTVYRYAHVGNLRTFLLGDLVRRTAEAHGARVRLVQNITDVGHLADDAGIELDGEDKLLAQARAEGKDPYAVARFYERAFHDDLAALGVRPADAYPRASESVGLVVDLVARLLDRGHAYVGGDGSVFFDARSFPTYGALSGNRLEDLRAGHRTPEAVIAAGKRFHADWALWKRVGQTRELTWDSPWGRGFPGWHVECSAMSLALLGDEVDLHLGGIDLRFPHHEDERAQSNAVAGREVVSRWTHAEHLLFEGRKMAKSTGNVVLLRDVVERGIDPLALRLAFLTSRYRQQADLSWDAVAAAQRTLDRWRGRVADWAEHPSGAMPAEARQQVLDAYDDDLDTPRALQALRKAEKDDALPPGSRFELFAWADGLLGLDLVREVGRRSAPVDLPRGAAALLEQRDAARAARDWSAADRLRDELAALGVVVTDAPTGQTWSVRGG